MEHPSNNNKNRYSQQLRAVAPLLAGLLGGGMSTVLLYPLDLVKVRLQVNESTGKRTFSQTFFAVVRHEGIPGLYQGLTPAVVGSSVSWGGYFFVYEAMKRQYGIRKQQHSHTPPSQQQQLQFHPLENFLLACGAGAIMVGITNPVWLIKTRMQLQLTQTAKEHGAKKPYTSMTDAARTIVREEGFSALYKGAIPALMLTAHGGVQFAVYEFLKRYFAYSRAKHDSSVSVSDRLRLSVGYLAIGAVSKIVASTTTYPLQVVKSRLQQRTESLELTATGDVKLVKRNYSGVWSTIRRIWKKEGIAGFFKGALTNGIRVAPSAAITFVVYESVLDVLE